MAGDRPHALEVENRQLREELDNLRKAGFVSGASRAGSASNLEIDRLREANALLTGQLKELKNGRAPHEVHHGLGRAGRLAPHNVSLSGACWPQRHGWPPTAHFS